MMSNTLMTMNPRMPPARRERLDSFADTPTDRITLSAEFLQALRQVAPRTRRRTLPYVLVLAAVAGLGVASGRRILLHPPGARESAPSAPAAGTPSATTTAHPADRAPSAPPSAPPTAASTTVSVGDLAPADKSKTPNTRHAKTPR